MNKDLFGNDIIEPKVYFKAVTTKNDDGFMMCDCGTSTIEAATYIVTTNCLKADEVPELCCDSKTFAELVAKLLNEYYNDNKNKKQSYLENFYKSLPENCIGIQTENHNCQCINACKKCYKGV